MSYRQVEVLRDWRQMARRVGAALMLAAASLMLPGAGVLHAADRKPNILVIVADDLGFGELSVQGNERSREPADPDAAHRFHCRQRRAVH